MYFKINFNNKIVKNGLEIIRSQQFFILSSTHLFEAFEGNVLLTGASKGSPIENLSGERYSTGSIDKPYSNELDATVFHIQSELSIELKQLAIGLQDLVLENDDEKIKTVYLAAGFRIKNSNTSRNKVNSKREAFPTIEVDDQVYEQLNINKETQFLTGYEDDVLVGEVWQKSPQPRGLSGGGLIKIEGTNILNPILSKIQKKQKSLG